MLHDDSFTVAEIIPFRSFREKIRITKEYWGKAKLEIVDNKFIYIEMRDRYGKIREI